MVRNRRFPLFASLGALALCGLWLRRRSHYSFCGKVVVITGGSRGLGLGLAEQLAKEGARLELLARNLPELERAAAKLIGGEVGIWPCDVRHEEQVKQTIAQIAEKTGRIDALINNAGIIMVGPLEKMAKSDFANAMQTHFWAPYYATMAALPFLAPGARVVNIASIGGRLAMPHLAPYVASKFALVGLSDALRNELKGVRVTTVCPGLMRTGSHRNAEFKGDYAREYGWFSLGATLPLVSIPAARAARQIVEAARAGRPELTITPQARLAAIAQAVAPSLVARLCRGLARLLPKARPDSGGAPLPGRECQSGMSPSIFTSLGEAAGRHLNEKPDP